MPFNLKLKPPTFKSCDISCSLYNISIEAPFCAKIDFSSDNTSAILNTSIVTKHENWNRETELKLSNILKRFKQENNVSSK